MDPIQYFNENKVKCLRVIYKNRDEEKRKTYHNNFIKKHGLSHIMQIYKDQDLYVIISHGFDDYLNNVPAQIKLLYSKTTLKELCLNKHIEI
jgi:hypothetical protein